VTEVSAHEAWTRGTLQEFRAWLKPIAAVAGGASNKSPTTNALLDSRSKRSPRAPWHGQHEPGNASRRRGSAGSNFTTRGEALPFERLSTNESLATGIVSSLSLYFQPLLLYFIK